MFLKRNLTFERPAPSGPDAHDLIVYAGVEVAGKVEVRLGEYVCVLDPRTEKQLINAAEVKLAQDVLIDMCRDIESGVAQ